MKFTPVFMAYWVCIFALVYVADILGLVEKYALDDKSLFFGFILGVLIFKLAPKNKNADDTNPGEKS